MNKQIKDDLRDKDETVTYYLTKARKAMKEGNLDSAKQNYGLAGRELATIWGCLEMIRQYDIK